MTAKNPAEPTHYSKNPARRLEQLLEDLLAQRIYVIEFAWHFTQLKSWLQAAHHWVSAQAADEHGLRLQAVDAIEQTGAALDHAAAFASNKDLSALDRAFGLAARYRFPLDELAARARQAGWPELSRRLNYDGPDHRQWQEQWDSRVTRHHGVTRATFRCKTCDWDFTFVSEVGSVEELELPFEELSCPFCHQGPQGIE